MAATDDVDNLIEQFHLAQDEFVKGNAEPTLRLFSHREDVTLGNPLWPCREGMEAGGSGSGACSITKPGRQNGRLRDHRKVCDA